MNHCSGPKGIPIRFNPLEICSSAKANNLIKPQKTSAFVERATDYWPERLASVSVASASVGTDIGLQEQVFQDVALFLDSEPTIVDEAKPKEARAKLRRTLQARQSEIFPQMRQRYAQLLADGLWENDIYVKTNGRTLIFTGVRFAANANIAATQQQVQQLAELMRFSRVEYRWLASSDGKYYTLDTPSDTAVGYWSSRQFQTVK